MLLRFRFSNFRSFRTEHELSLMAGPITDLPAVVRHSAGVPDGILPAAAIYGANASGKTNVMKAVSFMSSAVALSHRSWDPEGPIPREPFMADEESMRQPSEFEADFLIADVRHRYGFRIDSEAVLEEWLYVYPNGKKQTWFYRKSGEAIAFSKKMAGENKTIETLTRKNSLFLSAAAQNNHAALLPVYGWLAGILFVSGDRSPYLTQTALRCFEEPEVKDEIARLVSAADLGIADMIVQQPELTGAARVMAEIDKRRPAGQAPLYGQLLEMRLVHRFGNKKVSFDRRHESAGTITYLSLLGPAVDALMRGMPLLIDELDASLHPLLAIELIQLFNNSASNPKGTQLIFNTHDTNLLGSGVLRRDQIWFTEKKNDGTSHLFPLSDFKPRRQENLQNGYLQGRYGAIPFVNPDAFSASFEAGNGKAR